LVAHFVDDGRFERRGDDLYTDLAVPIYSMVLGGEVRVPTMTGDVTMTIPTGTQNNRRLRLGGKGMPKRVGGYGDLYVRLIGTVPSDLSARERELYEELARIRNHQGANEKAPY
jgi:curved DNA-binding protein